MTATQTQIRRDTAANLALAVPASSELAHNTTDQRLHIGDGSRPGGWPIPNFQDIQKSSFNRATVGGTSDAITLTHAPPMLSYTNACGRFKATSNNTTSVIINADTLGDITAKKLEDGMLTDLEADDIVAGCWYEWWHDGTYAQIKPSSWSGGSDAGWEYLGSAIGTNVAALDFTSGIDVTFQNYAFVLERLKGSPALWIRVRRAGQGSFDAGALDYRTSGLPGGGGGGPPAMQISSGLSSSSEMSGIVTAHALGQAAIAQFIGNLAHNAGSSPTQVTFAGVRESTSALDGVRFLASSGNITGRVLMYGLRNS